MLSYTEKATILRNCLEELGSSYADSFKTDLLFYFGDFEEADTRLSFLHKLHSETEIRKWVERINSLIVLKFNEEEEGLGDFVFYNSDFKIR